MKETTGISVRSFLIAGISAAVVGAAVVTPVSAPPASPARIAAAVQLTSISSGIQGVVAGVEGIFADLSSFSAGVQATIDHLLALPDGVQASIKNAYDSVERWPAYGAAWAQFSLGLIPGLWWIAPSIPLAYNTIEPLARAGAYSIADVVGLDFTQFALDIKEGISTSTKNAATYRKAWTDSFVAVPPLPPYPGPLPGSPDAAVPALPAASAATVVTPQASAVTSGVESAIKNTYNAVEPWVAWGFELAQWGMGFVPGLWWFAPGVSLAYFSIEPLVQAGVYTFADVLGLNFAQIGPDIISGIQQSAQNFVNYGLAWLQSLIPFPPLPPFPPRPGAVVAAAGAARAAAAIGVAEVPAAETVTAVTPDVASPGDSADKADTAQAPAIKDATPAVESATPQAETVSPATETAAPVAQTVSPEPVSPEPVSPETISSAVTGTVVEAPAASEAPRPSRGARLGHRAPAAGSAPAVAAGDGHSAENSDTAGHSSRSSR